MKPETVNVPKKASIPTPMGDTNVAESQVIRLHDLDSIVRLFSEHSDGAYTDLATDFGIDLSAGGATQLPN